MGEAKRMCILRIMCTETIDKIATRDEDILLLGAFVGPLEGFEHGNKLPSCLTCLREIPARGAVGGHIVVYPDDVQKGEKYISALFCENCRDEPNLEAMVKEAVHREFPGRFTTFFDAATFH